MHGHPSFATLGVLEPTAKEDLLVSDEELFFVGPDGSLSLCIFDTPVYDLNRGSFEEGWEGAVLNRRSIPLPDKHPCANCRELICCEVCPPVARMQTGDELGIPVDLCRLGKARSRMVARYLGGDKPRPPERGT